ncbi:Protein of unknown function [Salinibacillus kushneri]|uniref:Uncharacterized protein n=1 Tax=Salinibacillus kushneri TaxID=237682 RepID=A0A1I0AT05_9BACI|nr:DUF2512 family protein [Salinibacillus kushneri]SES97519.1 Protein of unknown function [Salinibacillus kushneri]
MRHFLSIGIKFVVICTVVLSLYSVFQNPGVLSLLGISIALVGLGYLLGDVLILRRFGNLTATLSDFALSFLVLFFYGIIMDIPTWEAGNMALFSALFITVTESLFHFYMQNRVFDEPSYNDESYRTTKRINSRTMQTETSDEVFPYDVRRKQHKKKNKQN